MTRAKVRPGLNFFSFLSMRQESEIYRECIRPPPNRTVHDSYLPFRCNSEGILSSATKASAGSSSSSSCSVGGGPLSAKSGKGMASMAKSSSSSPSSILAVCCAAASSTSLSSVDSGSHHHLHHHHHHHGSQGTDELSRLLLDMNGQPIVTRSKSMSTGSSYVSPAAPSSSSRLEATVKSCVRSLKERLGVEQSTNSVPTPDAVRRRPSSADQLQTTAEEDCNCSATSASASSSKLLASLPVLSCDSSCSSSSSSEGTPCLSGGL